MAKSVIDIVINAVNKTKKGLTEPITDLKSLQGAVDKVGPAFKVAAIAAVGALAYMVKGSIDAADSFQQMSDRTGIAVETLSAFGYAAKQSDTDLQSFAKGMKGLSEHMLSAAEGSEKDVKLFKSLGVEVKNADGTLRSADDVFKDLAGSFSKMEDGAAKNALAVRVFGKAGGDLIPMLNEGKDGLNELTTEAQIFGAVISGETAKAAADFNDNIDKLTAANTGLIASFTEGLIPSLVNVSDGFVQSAKDGSILQDTMRGLGRGVGLLVRMLDASVTSMFSFYKTAATGFGGIAQIAWAAAHGNFGKVKEIAADMFNYMSDNLKNVGHSWYEVWDPEQPKKAAEEGKKAVKAIAEEDAKAAAARKKAMADALKEQEEFHAKLGELLGALEGATLAIGETAKKNDEERKARLLEIAALEEELRLTSLQGYELDAAVAQALHDSRLRQIDELEAKGATKAETDTARVMAQKALEADLHAARVRQVNEITNAQGAMSDSLVAGVKVFTDSSIAGNKKVEKSMKKMWVTFRDEVEEAMLWYAARRAAEAIINIGVSYLEAEVLSKIWAKPALLAGIASGGVLPAAVAGELVIGTQAIPAMVAHGGLENVPKESTYFLDKGERVLSPKQNQDLTEFLSGGGSGGPMQVNILMNDEVLFKAVARGSRDGRVTIDARSIKS